MPLPLLFSQTFWLALPVVLAGIIHMVVVKKNWLSFLATPLDFGLTLRGKPIFGPNKTWRGVVYMVAASAGFGALEGALGGRWAHSTGIECLDFEDRFHSFAGGYALVHAVLGLGYVLGELPNSFLKRRVSIQPGKRGGGFVGLGFFVLDQADSVIAALLLGMLIFRYSIWLSVLGIPLFTLIHLVLNAALYAARVRRNL